MASGYLKAGVDLDSLFMARVNAKRADVGFLVAGVDISNRYEPIGAGTKIANVGHTAAGVDISNYFRNISEALTTITISDMTCHYAAAGSVGASYELRSSGDIFATNEGAGTVDRGDWLTPKSGMGNYSVYATWWGGSGGTPSGTYDTWLNLGTTRSWGVTQSTVGNASRIIDLQIRLDSSGAVLGTARITIQAQRTS